ncbi:beta-ketoacyl-[acyl-carrier-protein] synthase family protein [Chitinophagaceae bacterium LB-8]|uniref:Beta-ketoacyl-[acyl-carrier-protein] synthase family protein n=1 Tax=Paraflavisolibacter caeni TaxID=2982496 RepID=A0A9X2XZJ6_9BACT|nr:beta-ketoacyl-[acyl-carrier-protein] synthase family protein [Paraflavisolibacter caeni]MCU7551597.1 beta-ketoacyl-[acyl-carrier-protein] synthase family protein [Paraflavisolibacter caeni]
MKIFVTGIGVVSAIGQDAEQNLRSLQSLTTGLSRSANFNLMLGEVRLSNEQLIEKLDLPNEDYSRTTLLAILAAKEAWSNNKINKSVRTGLISATSVGGLDRTEKYYFESQTSKTARTYSLMTHDNGRTTERVAAELGISGYIGTISTACSSGANAIMQGARLLEGNKLDRVVVGASEPLATFDVKGFSSLNIFDNEICKPFDDKRSGLNLGEGAAYLVLENEHSISVTGNKPLCMLSGWNNATDAFHQTASSPDGKGAYLAMINALAKAGITAGNINYVNAHGTGTSNNDLSESMALRNVFGDAMPSFSSTKGFTGHTLAAAGAIEAVYCVQSILSQAPLPNLNFSTPMKETNMTPETSFRSAKIDYVLSNSFGFGGNCTCLIFGKAW